MEHLAGGGSGQASQKMEPKLNFGAGERRGLITKGLLCLKCYLESSAPHERSQASPGREGVAYFAFMNNPFGSLAGYELEGGKASGLTPRKN